MARGRVYRRRKPDGSLSKWNAVIDLPKGDHGKRRQITRTFSTLTDAHAWLAEVSLSDGTADASAPGAGPSMSEYLTQWLDGQVFLRPSTRASYRAHVDTYLIPAFGCDTVSQLTVAQVERLAHDLAAKGLAAGTVQRILATLRSAMAHAVRVGLIDRNPCTGVRVPSAVARPIRTWTPDEAACFLGRLERDIYGMLFHLALVTGMRRGELLGLRWSAVSLTGGFLHVETSRVAVGNLVVEGPPKSRAGVRSVFLDPGTIGLLGRWKALQAVDQDGEVELDGFVFTDAHGRPLTPWRVSRVFHRQVAALGLPVIRFHDLRHTSATLGLASGESLKEVSSRLGHSDIGITANVYSSVLPETARESAVRRASLMHGTRARFTVKRGAA